MFLRLSDIASGAFLGTEVSVLGWGYKYIQKCSGDSLPCLVLNNGLNGTSGVHRGVLRVCSTPIQTLRSSSIYSSTITALEQLDREEATLTLAAAYDN